MGSLGPPTQWWSTLIQQSVVDAVAAATADKKKLQDETAATEKAAADKVAAEKAKADQEAADEATLRRRASSAYSQGAQGILGAANVTRKTLLGG